MATETDEDKGLTLSQAIELAIEAQRSGQADTAAEIYRRVLAVWPESPDALHFSGLLAFQRGRLEEGMELIRRSLAVAPEHPDFWNNYGNVLRARKEVPEAAAAYRRALAIRPDFADAHNNLGTVLAQAGDPDAAETEFRAALGIQPGHVEAHLNLGATLEKRGMLDEACAAFQQVIALQPDSPTAYGRLGEILWRQGRREEATAAIIHNTRMNPGDPMALVILAGILWDQDRGQEAVEAYQSALEIDPRHSAANQMLARTLILLGRKTQATEVWRRWDAVDPENPIPRHHLAASQGRDVPARAADDFVVKIFDSFAESFDRKLERLQYRAPEIVTAALAAEYGDARAELDILDAGCGTGLCAPLLRPFARRLDGVDLSAGMLEKAKARGGYDHLHAAELTTFLASLRSEYDCIVSADTLCYFGDLDAVLHAATTALRPRGTLIFTVEESADAASSAGYTLDDTGRYTHTEEYIRGALSHAGFDVRSVESAVLRQEYSRPVDGLVVVAQIARG